MAQALLYQKKKKKFAKVIRARVYRRLIQNDQISSIAEAVSSKLQQNSENNSWRAFWMILMTKTIKELFLSLEKS